MSGSSLQDQLLKLGLVKKKPAAATRRTPRKPAAGGEDSISLARAYSERSRVEQRERSEAARRKREEEDRRRAVNARLVELVPPNARNEPQAEEARYFEYAGKIRKLLVTPAQQDGLNQGVLGIVSFKGRYYILEAPLIARVREIKPEALAFFAPDLRDGEEPE